MMELVPLALECAAFVSLLSLYSMSAVYINSISPTISLFCHGCLHYKILPVCLYHFLIPTIINVQQYPEIRPRLCPEKMA
jgi:hypothetical protein